MFAKFRHAESALAVAPKTELAASVLQDISPAEVEQSRVSTAVDRAEGRLDEGASEASRLASEDTERLNAVAEEADVEFSDEDSGGWAAEEQTPAADVEEVDGGDTSEEEEAATDGEPPAATAGQPVGPHGLGLGTFPTRRNRSRTLAKSDMARRPPLTGQQRLLLLDTWQRSGLPAGDFAELVGVSKHSLYKWKQHFTEFGPAGLENQPRASRRGSQLPDLTRRTILMLKQCHPEWGCQRISDRCCAARRCRPALRPWPACCTKPATKTWNSPRTATPTKCGGSNGRAPGSCGRRTSSPSS